MSSSDSLTPKTHSSVFQLAADAVSDVSTGMLNWYMPVSNHLLIRLFPVQHNVFLQLHQTWQITGSKWAF